MNSKKTLVAACAVGATILAGSLYWLTDKESVNTASFEASPKTIPTPIKEAVAKKPLVDQPAADTKVIETAVNGPVKTELAEKESQHETFDLKASDLSSSKDKPAFSSIPEYLEKQENLKRISFDDTCSYASCRYEDNVLVAKLGTNDTIDSLLAIAGVESVKPVFSTKSASNSELAKWVNITLKPGADLKSSAVELVNNTKLASVHPNYIRKLDIVASPDSLMSGEQTQWHHAAINTESAWQHLKSIGAEAGGSPSIVVAVIDTGIDVDHPDLIDAHWVNTNEIAGNGIDDDGNGIIDDIHGANFLPSPADGIVEDNHGHGTHVAGLVGAKNNGSGIAGVAPNVQIMTLKAGQSTGSLSSVDVAEAIMYAAVNGADVINMSFGGAGESPLEQDALAAAFSSSVLIASAGNDGLPNEGPCKPKSVAFYPASYPYVLGAQASDEEGKLTKWSNYDCTALNEIEYELTVPGSNILSTVPGGNFASWDGTSMSAPIASGVAALIRTKFPDRETYRSRFIAGQLTTNANLDALASLTTFPAPAPRLVGFELLDSSDIAAGNDGDFLADAGETVQLAVKLRNYKGSASNLVLTVTAESSNGVADPYISFVDSTSSLGTLGAYVSTDNGINRADNLKVSSIDDPIEFIVSPDAPNNHVVSLKFSLEANNALDATDSTTYMHSQYDSLTVQRGRTLPSILTDGFEITNDNLWIVDRPILVEENATVTVEAGAKIQFYSTDPRDYDIGTLPHILVRGQLLFNGTADRPIEVYPSELFAGWAVPILSNEDDAISLKYTHITNPYLHYDQHPDYPQARGAVKVDHSLFSQNIEGGIFVRLATDNYSQIPARVNYAQGTATHSIFKNLTYQYASSSYGLFNCQSGSTNLFTENNISLGSGEDRQHYGGECVFSDSVFLNNPYSILVKVGGSSESNNPIQRNAFLNQWNTFPTKNDWLTFSIPDGEADKYLTNNYWGDVPAETVHQAIRDRSDGLFDAGNIVVEPSQSTPSSSTYPFVVDMKLFDSESNTRSVFGAETVLAEITYNRAMDPTKEPTVSFGPAEPFADANFTNGEWLSSTKWRGEVQVIPSMESGLQYLCADGGSAANDSWLVAGRDCGRFTFEVRAFDVKSLDLQAVGLDGAIQLTWQQDDYDLLQGYNIYRSETSDSGFTKISQQLVSADESTFTDSSVESGKTYYYYFTVSTDSEESEASNIVSASAIDDVAPEITHTPRSQATQGSNYVISADASDNVSIESVAVMIRRSNEQTYQKRTLSFIASSNNDSQSSSTCDPAMDPLCDSSSNSGSGTQSNSALYSVTIEGSYISQDFEYYLIAKDDAANETLSGSANDPVSVSVILPSNEDSDGDGVLNGADAFPYDPNETLDTDNDGKGNATDVDDDGDGVIDAVDKFPLNNSEWLDSDNDGVGNNEDQDDDNDSVADYEDAFPTDNRGSLDSDSDGLPNAWEISNGLNPNDPSDANSDKDFDGSGALEEFANNTAPNQADSISQIVFTESSLKFSSTETNSLAILYRTSDENSQSNGLGVRVHFDSNAITSIELANPLLIDLIGRDTVAQDDVYDYDDNAETDKYLSIAWGSQAGTWPGILPAKLFDIEFALSSNLSSDNIVSFGFSTISTDPDYRFSAESILGEAGLQSLDIDGSGSVDPLTDGLIILRHLFGFTGDAVLQGALASNAQYSTAAEVTARLEAAAPSLDIDGDGSVEPLTDGLLILRYLFGFRGEALVTGSVGTGATRSSPSEIETYLGTVSVVNN